MTSSRDLWKLQKSVEEEIEERKEEMLDGEPYDVISEIVDGRIPVYYGQLAAILAEDTNMGQVEDEGLLPENPTVWQIISIAIYEQLSNHAHEYWGENEDEWREAHEE